MDDETKRLLVQGPQPTDARTRRAAIEQIVSRLESAYGASIVAIGLYGSTARDADRDYSDIELFCVVSIPGECRRREWVDADGKYEVEVFGADVVRNRAAELDEAWPVTHAKYANPRILRGGPALFAELKRLVFDHSEADFHEVIRSIIVGEMFEGLGKVRNSMSSGGHDQLPRVLMRIATMAQLLVGLAHRHIFTSSGLAAVESMQLAPRPSGHDELCTMAMRGELDNPDHTSEVIERYWIGVVEWAADMHIDLALACKWPF